MAAVRRKRSKPVPRKKARQRTAQTRRWSGHVTRHSNALDLEAAIFKSRSPRRIAQSLKNSALASKRRKGTPYQSAMSMLNFYINRAGRGLAVSRRRVLEQAKRELRRLYKRA